MSEHPVTTTPEPTLTRNTAWVLWSHKHGAWWAPYRQGYTRNIQLAGVYTEAEAKQLEADSQWGPEEERTEARRLTHVADLLSPMRPGSVTWLLTLTEGPYL